MPSQTEEAKKTTLAVLLVVSIIVIAIGFVRIIDWQDVWTDADELINKAPWVEGAEDRDNAYTWTLIILGLVLVAVLIPVIAALRRLFS